jgi:DNA-binding transcriptional LysR family regulator
LEEEFGVQLLVRDRRRVLLTSAGQTFLTEAKKLMLHADQVREAVIPASRGEHGLIRVGIAAGLGDKVAAVVRAHGSRFPGVELECKDILSTLQNQALLERRIDVGVLRPPANPEHLTSEFLFHEPIHVLLAKTNPLARFKKLRIRQLANETLLLHQRFVSSGIYDKTLDVYSKAGVKPKIVHTPTGPYEEAGTMLVAMGRGIYLVGGTLQRAFKGEVTSVPIADRGATFEVHMAWRKDEKSASVLNLLDTIRSVFKTRTTGRV